MRSMTRPVVAQHDARPPGVPADSEHRGRGRDAHVVRRVDRVGGQVRRVVVPQPGRLVQRLVGLEHTGRHTGLDGGDGAPAHAQVALDGARHRRRRDHLASQRGVLRVKVDDGVDVGGGAADVDHDHVAGQRRGEHLDPGEHEVGRGAAHHRREVRAGAQVLATDHVGQEHLADRGPCGAGGEHADPGDDVVGEHVRRGRRGQEPRDVLPGVDVAGHHDRRRPARPGQHPCPGQQRLGVAAVGASDQQHHVGPAGEQSRQRVGVGGQGDHVHHLAAARQRDPASGLGRDQLLVADHGDPEPAAGRRARQHLRAVDLGMVRSQRAQARVVPVEDVGVDRGAVRGGAEQGARPGVDEGCLGERRPEVDAQHRVNHRGRPPGPRPGRRRSRCRRSAGSGRTAPRARCRRPRRASSGPGARSATRRRRATPRA